MDETQIHHLSTSHIEPTLLGYLKMHIIFLIFSKYCALNQLNSEHIHGHSQNMWRIYFDLIHIFPTNFLENLSKCIHTSISFASWNPWFSHDFLKKTSFSRNRFLKKLWGFSKIGFPKLSFHSFPWKPVSQETSKLDFQNQSFLSIFLGKYYFLKIFKRSFPIFLKNQKSIFKGFKAKIPRISISQVQFSSQMSFPINFPSFS